MGNITITFTRQPEGLKIQGTCERLSDSDVLYMLDELADQINHSGLMTGLHDLNGGYFETIVTESF